MGIRVDDIEVMARETRHVAGRRGGNAASGDPSPFTAQGVHAGLRVAATWRLDRPDLRGVRVAVQGVGSVGMSLCQRLHAEGARLIVSDPCEQRVREAQARFGARGVAPDAILATACDVLAPCALGGVLDDASIPRLRARVVAGAANNQLAEPRHAQALAARGILYVPDFVLNAGGIVNVAAEVGGDYDPEEVSIRVDSIGHRVAGLLRESRTRDSTPQQVALEWARCQLGSAAASAGGGAPERRAPPVQRSRPARRSAAS